MPVFAECSEFSSSSQDRSPCVIIIDDDPDVRHAISLLVQTVDLESREFTSAQEFLEAYDPNQPGCLVVDLRMPGMTGLELQKQAGNLNIHLPMIFITAHGEIETSSEAMRDGAIDFLAKPFRPQVLLDRIHEAIAIDNRKRQLRKYQYDIDKLKSRLTEREMQVMDLLICGDSTKVAARKLGISQKTVDNHRSKILEKMEVDNTTQLAAFIYRHGRG